MSPKLISSKWSTSTEFRQDSTDQKVSISPSKISNLTAMSYFELQGILSRKINDKLEENILMNVAQLKSRASILKMTHSIQL